MGFDPRLYRQFLVDAIREGRMPILAAKYRVSVSTAYRMRKKALGDGALTRLGECALAVGPNFFNSLESEIVSRPKAAKNQWKLDHPEETREMERRHRFRIRMEALIRYGGNPPVCVCCGEMHIEFLCIDHINGGGNDHRRAIGNQVGTSFFRWLKRNGYPSGFRVLCDNCNMALARHGFCPHEIEKVAS